MVQFTCLSRPLARSPFSPFSRECVGMCSECNEQWSYLLQQRRLLLSLFTSLDSTFHFISFHFMHLTCCTISQPIVTNARSKNGFYYVIEFYHTLCGILIGAQWCMCARCRYASDWFSCCCCNHMGCSVFACDNDDVCFRRHCIMRCHVNFAHLSARTDFPARE